MKEYISRWDALKALDKKFLFQEKNAIPFDEKDGGVLTGLYMAIRTINSVSSADVVTIELVAEMFDNVEPCNFGLFGVSVDDFMFKECGDWCESNCDKVPAVECWKKFFEAWEERKDEWIR